MWPLLGGQITRLNMITKDQYLRIKLLTDIVSFGKIEVNKDRVIEIAFHEDEKFFDTWCAIVGVEAETNNNPIPEFNARATIILSPIYADKGPEDLDDSQSLLQSELYELDDTDEY